jgi:glycosyltransferase involved in cell wall biosynthesis
VNITLVGTAYPYRGGIAHWNTQLARALSRRHVVDVVNFRRQYPSLLFPGTSQMESAGIPPGMPTPRLVDSINPLNWLRVGWRLRTSRPDLLLFRYWMPFFGPCFGTIARVARSNGHTRVLTICDNILPHERRPLDASFTRYAFGSSDAFLVQSDAVERDLRAFLPGALYAKAPHPVYDMFGAGVDRHEARARLGIRSRRLLLFFGYVRPYKGVHVLLDACARLDPSLDVHLLVAGEFYEDEGSYRGQIARLGIDTRVTLHNVYSPPEAVRDYFSAADAVVLPYLSATQSGIAQIAYNFDRPVIVTNVGGLAEIVDEGVNGTVVPPGDPAALADAIERFYRAGGEEAMPPQVRARKQRYSWDAMVTAIETLAGRIGVS